MTVTPLSRLPHRPTAGSRPYKRAPRGRVTKAMRERCERMKAMSKLQKMVPTAKASDSPFKLLLRVIEYMNALQVQLQEVDARANNSQLSVEVSELRRILAQCSIAMNRIHR
ncbi:unnamed protein product [Toxocara canis]|uniref:BHLH domain-containing protein n=1 Tax=Toxocara canis TaxID=6265 RepID=A0A183V351_TOXCA|nr:unnamed protein product [Toxocara canis]